MSKHPLYVAALAADMKYTAAIQFVTRGHRDRWTLTAEDEQAQAIAVSLREKIAADEAWLSHMSKEASRG